MKQRLAVLLLLSLLAQVSHAQNVANAENAPWYHVDLLIFAQPGDHLTDEAWDPSVFPTLSNNVIDINSSSQNLVIMDASNSGDLPVATSLMKRKGYEVLYRKSWNQMMLPKAETRPIRIKAGEVINNGFHRLDGEISIDIARYLHFRTQLFYSVPVSNAWLEAQKPPAAEETDWLSSSSETVSSTQDQATAWNNPATQQNAPSLPNYLTVKMEQSRRMRRDELHYIDHPYLGIVVRMTKLNNQNTEQPDTPIDLPKAPATQ